MQKRTPKKRAKKGVSFCAQISAFRSLIFARFLSLPFCPHCFFRPVLFSFFLLGIPLFIVGVTIVEQCGLRLGTSKSGGSICAVSALREIFEKNGYDGLDRTVKLVVKTWEGDANSLTASMLRGVSLIVATFGDSLRDELFAERIGSVSAREIARTAKERRAGSIGFAETMLLLYNKKTKSTLSMTRLHNPEKSKGDGLSL